MHCYYNRVSPVFVYQCSVYHLESTNIAFFPWDSIIIAVCQLVKGSIAVCAPVQASGATCLPVFTSIVICLIVTTMGISESMNIYQYDSVYIGL